MAAHALLSASGSKRWMTCTPSARLEEQFPEETSSYAEEGTLAHSLAEVMLRDYLAAESGESINDFILENGIPSDMVDYIELYCDVVIERIEAARAICKDAIVMLEQRLDFSRFVPDGFGTGDVVIIADGQMEVIDLKYGKGVPVSAINNSQMRLYGLGAADAYTILYDITQVRMTIVQPRLDSVSEETLMLDELELWGLTEVVPRAKMAIEGKGEFHPCDDACKFCRARHVCKARADSNMSLVEYDFADSFLLTPEQVADILTRVDALVNWANDIKDYALSQAENHGVTWPGFKLVEGRSNRVITDTDAAYNVLFNAGYPDAQVVNSKLKGIGDLEKLLGKQRFADLLGEYVAKPAGKPVLVPEADKRPAIGSTAAAERDFSDMGPTLMEQHKEVQRRLKV